MCGPASHPNLSNLHVCHGNKVDICHVEKHSALRQPRQLSDDSSLLICSLCPIQTRCECAKNQTHTLCFVSAAQLQLQTAPDGQRHQLGRCGGCQGSCSDTVGDQRGRNADIISEASLSYWRRTRPVNTTTCDLFCSAINETDLQQDSKGRAEQRTKWYRVCVGVLCILYSVLSLLFECK